MVELNENTIGMAFAVIGVIATIVWYALAWYGIRTLQDVRATLGDESQNGN